MSKRSMSRRTVLGLAAGAAATAIPAVDWVFAVGGDGAIVRAATEGAGDWEPLFFSRDQAETLAVLAEAIIPRTDTPGARDARVHEFIDLELSLLESSAPRRFVAGLEWVDERCKKEHGQPVVKADASEVHALLESISDLHEKHPAELKEGVRFFKDLKRRTIFAYYTSAEGRIELGLPKGPAMGKYKGCQHSGDDHTG